LKKRLRYPHTGAQVQQHVARGMEQMRIYYYNTRRAK